MTLTDINDIRALLTRHGFRFSKSLGQNFLTASWVPEKIADSAMLDEKTGVLEVGPGVGCLTAELSKRAGAVVAVELDKALKPVLKETLADCDNVEVIFSDVLKLDLNALVQERFQGLRPTVCANLPYNVTSPLLTAFVKSKCFDTITVMIQREVADRICAKADTPEYGAFSLLIQWYTEAEKLFDVPPSCFIPQPKVVSSVIQLKRRGTPAVKVKDEELMFKLIRAAFNQRRKTLVNALSSALPAVSRENLAECIDNCGFDTRIRGETLDVGGFAKISDEISNILGTDL